MVNHYTWLRNHIRYLPDGSFGIKDPIAFFDMTHEFYAIDTKTAPTVFATALPIFLLMLSVPAGAPLTTVSAALLLAQRLRSARLRIS